MQSASYESCMPTKTLSVVYWAMDCAYTFREGRVLREEYYKITVPMVDEQLAKAGVRLAKVLNETFGKE